MVRNRIVRDPDRAIFISIRDLLGGRGQYSDFAAGFRAPDAAGRGRLRALPGHHEPPPGVQRDYATESECAAASEQLDTQGQPVEFNQLIELRNVSFAYQGASGPVIRDVSLE